jgi:hypothetical protein
MTTASKDEQIGKRIARKVLREMLASSEHREDIKQVAARHVSSYREGLYARKHINIYCRLLAAALSKLP